MDDRPGFLIQCISDNTCQFESGLGVFFLFYMAMTKTIEIWTGYYANLPEDIVPVSIAGRAPDGWKGLEYKKVAPKKWFFMEWKKNRESLTDDYYVRNFNEYVLGALDPVDIIKDLLTITSGAVRIVLVCYEKPGDFCHRHLVHDWLKEAFKGNPGLMFMGEWQREG